MADRAIFRAFLVALLILAVKAFDLDLTSSSVFGITITGAQRPLIAGALGWAVVFLVAHLTLATQYLASRFYDFSPLLTPPKEGLRGHLVHLLVAPPAAIILFGGIGVMLLAMLYALADMWTLVDTLIRQVRFAVRVGRTG